MKPNHVMLVTLASLAVLVPFCNSYWIFQEVDECAENPCHNGAVCEDLIDDYRCVCPNGYTGKKCETELLSQYQLDFVNPSIMDYAELTIDQPLNTVSVSLWLRTTDKANHGTPFSYALHEEPNALTFTNYQSPSLYINGEVTSIYTGQSTLNDGRWHHVVLIWSSVRGDWKAYVDGVTADQGFDLSTAKPIPGKGKFIVGQEQDLVGGGFDPSETFIGTLTHLNVWDRELSLSEIENLMFDCEGVHEGNVIAWPDFQEALEGDIRANPSSFCVECPTPENPGNGQVSYTSTKSGSTAELSCDIGYYLAGKPDYKCLITGTWDGTFPQCYVITCRPPGFIRNGYYIGHHFPYGSQIDFQCNPGYELDGPDRLTCTEWGSFDGDPPECVEIKCTVPPLSKNTLASTSGTRFRPGTRVDFTCRTGSSMQTKHNSMRCQRDGSWDRSVPSCDPLPKCGYPPFIANGEPFTVVSEYNVGDISRYECDFGYEFDPEASNSRGVINCLPSGDWSTDLPVCRPITCPDPPSLPNTVQHSANHTFMSVVIYTCVVGFEPQGTSEIECQEDRTWSEPSFRCTVLDCGEPPNLTSGSLHYQENLNWPMAKDTLFNSTVSYQCDQGYILAGDDTRRCQEDGKWSGSDPFCEPTLCEDLSDVPNGHVDYTNKTYLSKAKYSCDRGFELDGFSELTCGASGQWSPNPPTCGPRSCPVPQTIQFGSYTVSVPFVYNTSLEYVCITGYELIGTRRSVCQEDGTWSEPPPQCQQDLKDGEELDNLTM